MTLHVLPQRHRDGYGCIHVMPAEAGGYEVSHESASGNSWGDQHGPFAKAHEAASFAFALNIHSYGGACNVGFCAAALQEMETL